MPGTLLDARGVSRRHGARVVLENVDLTVHAGARLGLIGPNGSGKSSLLGALAGELPLADGRRSVAASAAIALLGQGRRALAGERPVAAAVAERAGISEADVRTTLASFGLSAEVVERPATSLSAGEVTRAELALLARRRVRCLLLDEPTNHLDVESLEILEAALAEWPGALVVATHDARLRQALRVERVVEVLGRVVSRMALWWRVTRSIGRRRRGGREPQVRIRDRPPRDFAVKAPGGPEPRSRVTRSRCGIARGSGCGSRGRSRAAANSGSQPTLPDSGNVG
jgi:ATPase subunit of ABC transporter with duplicated ATPase domains